MGYFVAFSETNAGVAGVEVVRRARSPALLSLYAPAWTLAFLSFVAGVLCAEHLQLTWGPLLKGYVKPAVLVTLIMVLPLVFFQAVGLLRSGHANPRRELVRTWINKDRLVRLALPTIAAPVFLTGFTMMKCFSTVSRAYDWDRLLTGIDQTLFFGVDPWVLTHDVLNIGIVPALMEFTYILWQFALIAALAGAALWMKRKNLATFYTAMFSTWLVGGVVFAVWMHSAGPIFVHLYDVELGQHFAPLTQSLTDALGTKSRILWFNLMLPAYIGSEEIRFGGGISAMPSMHVAATAIYVFAAWSHRVWKWLALTFSALIWVGSIYFGYHYATDGPIAYAIAGLCWMGARAVVGRLSGHTIPGGDVAGSDYRYV